MIEQVNLLDLAASAVASTVAASRPIRDLSTLNTDTPEQKNARLKVDGSVVTDADFAAQGIIVRALRQVSRHIRIVGEESEEEMVQHIREDDSAAAESSEIVFHLAQEEMQMRYHCRSAMRPPLADPSASSETLTSPEDISPSAVVKAEYIVDASRVSVFVDPLDGTKSYARADYESVTVLIAIVLDNQPCFGVICKPFGCEGIATILETGCVAVYGGSLLNGVYVAGGAECAKPTLTPNELPRAVISRSRSGGIVRDLVDVLASKGVLHSEPIHVSGAGEKSLRLVLGTENEALWFFPMKGTSRWDVAASDALLRQLGGKLTDKYGHELDYSRSREDAENSEGVIACNDEALHAECIKLFQERIEP